MLNADLLLTGEPLEIVTDYDNQEDMRATMVITRIFDENGRELHTVLDFLADVVACDIARHGCYAVTDVITL